MSYEYEASIKEAINIEYHADFSGYMNRIKEIDHVYSRAAKVDEYEAKNKELLEELQYLRKVNDDLVWQRDTDEEHEAKATAWDIMKKDFEGIADTPIGQQMLFNMSVIMERVESGESE